MKWVLPVTLALPLLLLLLLLLLLAACQGSVKTGGSNGGPDAVSDGRVAVDGNVDVLGSDSQVLTDAGEDAMPTGAIPLQLFNLTRMEPDPRFVDLPAALSVVQLPGPVTLLASVAPEVRSVRFTIDGDARLDDSAPFRLTEDAAGDATAWEASPGTYNLLLEAFNSADASGEAIAVLERTLEITTSGVDPTPDEGEHAVERWWLTTSGKFVRLNGGGDFVDGAGDVVIAAADVSLEDRGEGRRVYVSDGADSIEFAFIVRLPDGFDPAVPYPVIVFLHHGSNSYQGTDNDGDPMNTPMFTGENSIVRSSMRIRHPAIVLVPQASLRETIDGVFHEWAAFTDIDGEGHSHSAEVMSNSGRRMRLVLDGLIEGSIPLEGGIPTIDAARLYMTGHSMGGLGTWDLLAREPSFWAAGIPMAGYADHDKAADLKDTPIWCFHHRIDSYNAFRTAETMHRLITEAPNNGTRMILTPLEFDTGGAGDQAHFRTPNEAWNGHPEVFDWLFAQVATR